MVHANKGRIRVFAFHVSAATDKVYALHNQSKAILKTDT